MDRARVSLRKRAALALAVLFLVRCLWLPAHLAFEHHHSPGASAAAFGFAHGHGHGHAHGHGHGHGDSEGPSCPEQPHPHAASDHQPDMRVPRTLQGTPLPVDALAVFEVVLPEPVVRRAPVPSFPELLNGRAPPPLPPARAPPIA